MSISYDLISQFAKEVTKDTKKTGRESTVYGTIVIDEHGDKYVRLDGSDLLTPITNTSAMVNDNERVSVLIKNHTATVTGNISSPAARTGDVENLGDQVSQIQEFDILIAKQVQANEAYFKRLIADEATLAKLVASEASIIELLAQSAEIDKLLAEKISVTDLIAAKIDADVVIADKALIESLKASNIDVLGLVADKAVLNKLIAEDADLNSLEAKNAYLKYANIDFSNIGEAAIVKLFSESGIIKDLIVSEGTITGELVGVTIKGDLIEAGTLKADKLVVKGSDGLYYKLNIEAGAVASAEVSEEELQNGLHGTAIIAKTITAEKIAVDDLVAFGATIGGFHITTNSLYSGVKESIHNPTRGIYMDDDGQIAIGDDDNYIKFYEDDNGKHKLEISLVDKLKIGARNLIRNSTDLIYTEYGFHSNIYPVDADIENGVLVLKPYPTSPSTFASEIADGRILVRETYETAPTIDMSLANDIVTADCVTRHIPLPDPSGSTGSGSSGASGSAGSAGSTGGSGKDGISATHTWTGTVLTITSASGTSSADLRGPKGDKGDKGTSGVGIKSITITKI